MNGIPTGHTVAQEDLVADSPLKTAAYTASDVSFDARLILPLLLVRHERIDELVKMADDLALEGGRPRRRLMLSQ